MKYPTIKIIKDDEPKDDNVIEIKESDIVWITTTEYNLIYIGTGNSQLKHKALCLNKYYDWGIFTDDENLGVYLVCLKKGTLDKEA